MRPPTQSMPAPAMAPRGQMPAAPMPTAVPEGLFKNTSLNFVGCIYRRLQKNKISAGVQRAAKAQGGTSQPFAAPPPVIPTPAAAPPSMPAAMPAPAVSPAPAATETSAAEPPAAYGAPTAASAPAAPAAAQAAAGQPSAMPAVGRGTSRNVPAWVARTATQQARCVDLLLVIRFPSLLSHSHSQPLTPLRQHRRQYHRQPPCRAFRVRVRGPTSYKPRWSSAFLRLCAFVNASHPRAVRCLWHCQV